MTYDELVARLANAGVYATTDADFAAMAPQAIEQAELRCLRDLDPVVARSRATQTLAAGTASLVLPSGCVAARAIWLQVSGAWRRLERRDPDFLDFYSADGAASVPRYWASRDGVGADLAPGWAAGGNARIDFTARPALMSSSNQTTWLGQWVPDLLFYAAMIFVVGFQRSFADQATEAAGWQSLYEGALAGAVVEERRRKADGPFDNSRTPPVSAVAPQG